MPLYFAYGSNMSAPQMAQRCPGAVSVGPVCLPAYQFRIATHGGATIVSQPASEVHGVLWSCTPWHIGILDRYEGVRIGAYYRRYVMVAQRDGKCVRALAYIGRRPYPGTGRANYMLTAVIPGAIAHGLPSDYVASLHAWLPRVAIGEKRKRYRGRKR